MQRRTAFSSDAVSAPESAVSREAPTTALRNVNWLRLTDSPAISLRASRGILGGFHFSEKRTAELPRWCGRVRYGRGGDPSAAKLFSRPQDRARGSPNVDPAQLTPYP